MNQLSTNIDPMDYHKLVCKHVNGSNKRGYHRQEFDDEYQAGMIGVILATKRYDSSRGSFETFAYWYIQREINSLYYRNTQIKKVRQLVSRVEESQFSDWSDDHHAEAVEDSFHSPSNVLNEVQMEEFIANLPFEGRKLTYVYDILLNGEEEANRKWMEDSGVSRQRIHQKKAPVLKKLREYFKEMF